MILKYKNLITTLALLAIIQNCNAKKFGFSLGTGYQFYLIPELSRANEKGDLRWYMNSKIGNKTGFSIGFEKGFGSNNHALGAFVGSLGVKKKIFSTNSNKELSNGLGLTYSYSLNGLNNEGLWFRLELGYGEVSKSNNKRVDGGIVVSYLF